jgi:hypothetical protein
LEFAAVDEVGAEAMDAAVDAAVDDDGDEAAATASPAAGAKAIHVREQNKLIEEAFGM